VRLFLSEQGQAMAHAAEQVRRAAFAELLQGLDRSEQAQLLGLLQKCQQPPE
jgi:MarR family transcriptional repressor of mexAB-oprM operon